MVPTVSVRILCSILSSSSSWWQGHYGIPESGQMPPLPAKQEWTKSKIENLNLVRKGEQPAPIRPNSSSHDGRVRYFPRREGATTALNKSPNFASDTRTSSSTTRDAVQHRSPEAIELGNLLDTANVSLSARSIVRSRVADTPAKITPTATTHTGSSIPSLEGQWGCAKDWIQGCDHHEVSA